jgi:hypothetical protein
MNTTFHVPATIEEIQENVQAFLDSSMPVSNCSFDNQQLKWKGVYTDETNYCKFTIAIIHNKATHLNDVTVTFVPIGVLSYMYSLFRFPLQNKPEPIKPYSIPNMKN